MFDGLFTKVSQAPEFPTNFDWINTEKPLSLEKLRGHIVVLDFWTYCCINCMHMLPALGQLEKKYEGKPIVFIGVHSAKFFNEQDRKNIEQAVRRYEIAHPVIVDKEMTVWRRYGVSGWPTIVIIDPNGTIVYKQSGEGQKELIDDTIEVLLEKNSRKGLLAKEPVKISFKLTQDKTTLSYPGKLSISNGKLAISDSNHNRIIVTDLNGKIEHVVGNGQAGLVDGSFDQASFFRPQGVAWKGNQIFVADTENHALRRIDLQYKKVVTVAGTGRQGPWISSGGKGREAGLSSPWDVAVNGDLVFIAMAGNHQIWTYDTTTDTIRPFAGNGHENIVDGDKASAQLAQPSGVAVYGDVLYFVDSETSSVREIDLKTNHLRTIAGQGLFVFGHKDGNLHESLFQHPLGVCANNGRLFVADTYNSALRIIDLENEKTSTIIGRHGTSGICRIDDPNCDTLALYEPSDVEFYNDKLYVADTNNHLIREYDLILNILKTLDIKS